VAQISPEVNAAWQTLNEAQSRMRSDGLAAGLSGMLGAVQQFRRAGDRTDESYALGLLAGVHHELGNFREAADYHRAGLEAARSIQQPGTRIAEHLDGLAMALSNMGLWQEAEVNYKQAIEETRKPIRAFRKLRAHVIKHLADLYARYTGRLEEAIAMYDEAIAISLECDDQYNVAAALNFKGLAFDNSNRREDAVNLYEQSRLIAEKIGDKGLLASCLAHLGTSYLNLGNAPLARQYVVKALALDKEVGNKQGACRDLWLLGQIQDNEGDEKATETLQDALLLSRKIGDFKVAVHVLRRLARLAGRRLQGGRAKEYLEQALAHSKDLGDKHAEIELTVALSAYEDVGEMLARLQQGIASAREIRSEGLEQDLEEALADLYERNGDLLQAREHYAQAAELLERMRSGYKAEEHLRAFSRNTAHCYERLVDISLQLREDTDAFLWAERSRARVLQIMRNNRQSQVSAVMSDQQRIQYRQVCDRVIDLDMKIQILERKGESGVDRLQEDLREALLREADLVLSARRMTGATEQMPRQEILPGQLTQWLASLRQRVLVLSYYIGTSGIYVFCSTAKTFYVQELGSSAEEVRKLIHQFREKLGVPESDARVENGVAEIARRDPVLVEASSEPQGDYVLDSQRLYEILLRPIQAEIAAAEHICVIPYGPLHFLPFHALHDGEQYLIEQKAVSYAPSATILLESSQGGSLNIDRVLALGEPACDLKPLPFAREEVERVQKILGPERCRTEFGADALRTVVLDAGGAKNGQGGDDVWHFAMHAMFVQSAPQLSYLQLAKAGGDDGRLFAYEVAALPRAASLTVMSACRTAMTREARGDELSGLLYSFLVAGAQTVIATLWSVADESTAALIVQFYDLIDKEPLGLAEALQKAQIALLRSPRTSSPYYWAPIALYCNWNPGMVTGGDGGVRTIAAEAQVAALPIQVLIRKGASLLGRARIEGEKYFLPKGEKEALGQAIEIFDQVLEREPDNPVALRQRGIAHYALYERDKAEPDLLKACRIDQKDAVAAAVLGLIYADGKRDCAAAVFYLERAFALDHRLHLHYPSYRTYSLFSALERCRAELAVRDYTRRLETTPNDPSLYAERGQAYWLLSFKGDNHQENSTKAIADFDRALVLDRNNALAIVRRAWMESLNTGSPDIYAHAVQVDPGCAEAHMRLAQCLPKKETARSLAEIQLALECDPSIPHAHCRIAQRYLDQGDLRRAIEEFEREVRIDPNCFDAYLYLTQIYAALGRTQEARHSLRESVRTSSHQPYEGGPGVGLLDSIVYAIRDLARRMLAEQESDSPKLPLTLLTSLFDQANAIANRGQSREAAEIYTEILRHDPNNARAYSFRGGCYATLKENDKAIADLLRATELNPDNADAWFNLSLVYFNQMKYDESLAAKERARLLDPDMVKRKRAEDDRLRTPPAQTEPFDLEKALQAAYREARMECAHCGRALRRPLGTQFAIPPAAREKVREGIPYYCPLCRVNSCGACATEEKGKMKCSRCLSEMEEWGEAKQVSESRPLAQTKQDASGPCASCRTTGPLRLGRLCWMCYAASAQAMAGLNYEGQTSTECGRCGAKLPVQLAEVFSTGGGDIECRACFGKRLSRLKSR
jgi:CHAT domain-containing protein/Tfp pilus assembly protein PilF